MSNLLSIFKPKSISADEVITYLCEQIVLPTTVLRNSTYEVNEKERRVQNALVKQFEEIYGKDNVHKEYAIGGFWNMRSDIDLFDGKIGIELKVAEQLKSAAGAERLLGQTIYYARRKYGAQNFIVVIVGKEKEYDASMKELESIIKEHGVQFVYLTTK